MIPKAREVRLKPKTRKVLEARCRAPTTAQRDVKRARIVLLAAEGRSTRSIAEEVGVQPRIVSNWRRRFAEHGLADCRTGHGPARSRSTARPRTSAFWRFLISRRLRATPDERVRCWPRHWATLMFSMSGASCASTYRPCRPQVVVREQRPFVRGESRRCGRALCRSARQGDCSLCRRKAFDPGVGACARLFEAAERLRPDRPEPRLQAARHHDLVRSARSRHRQDHRGAFQAPPPCRVPRLHEQRRRRFPGRELHVILDNLNTHKKNQRWLKKHPTVHFHITPTRSSWLNQIETWFSILQGQSLNGASFTAIEQLQEYIDAFIAAYNETAEPFAWNKKKVYQRRFKNCRITQL